MSENKFKKLQFETSPFMLAAWPGLGNVGIIAIDYLRKKLEAQPLAQIDMSTIVVPQSMTVKNGMIRSADLPESTFHYRQHPDIIFFESDAQIKGREGLIVLQTILQTAHELKVKKILTAAAFSQQMSHTEKSNILCTSNNEMLLEDLQTYGISPLQEGHIAGLNGLLLGIARSRGIDAACLLGTMPSYAGSFAYPKASLEIIKIITNILNVSIDLSELEEAIIAMDQLLDSIEKQIENYMPNALHSEESNDSIHTDKPPKDESLREESVSKQVMDKIEMLFKSVEHDKSKAGELKKELDRWDLYKLYEKRFLDLFKDDNLNEG